MILNRFEYALVNNPIRAAMQRYWVAKQLLRMGGPVPGGTVLEIGCGRGIGVEIILDLFEAKHVDAFDLDARMISRAQNRLRRRAEEVRIWDGDVTAIAADSDQYDAVFAFGIIHHVPDWRLALSEVHRVLKPGGRFYAEEALKKIVTHWLVRRLSVHPQEDRFTHEQFCAAMNTMGFDLIDSKEMPGGFGWYVAEKPAVVS
ncbi:MAG: class I SAM-dependent methyltransferase [Bacteroidetes bacterium]|nr:class I SAM-dependent methyltransferase [Bacteroidota bacterium]